MTDQWLVRKLLEQDKKIEALSRGGTGVGHTSIAPGEALTVLSDDGEVVLGAGGVEYVDGPTPATPSAPTLKLGFGTIEVTWDGSFAEGEDENGIPLVAPIDFDVAEVHCSTDPLEEEWGDDTRRGQIKTREGGTITVGGFDVDDEVFVCLIALAKTGKRSAPSATASLVIEGLDFSQLFNELDAANATIKNAGEILVTEQGTLDEKLTEAFDAINAIEVGARKIHFEERPPTVDDPGTLGDTWFVGTVAGGVISNTTAQFYYGADGWTEMKLSHEVIGSVDVGTLVAGSAVIKQAVIDKLWAEVVVAKMVVAEEFIGENAILTGAVTAPKITASEELWAKIGEFVKIRAEQLEADAIDGMVITGPNIRTAASGARVQLDAGGLRIFNDNDEVRTQLSPDGSTFKGEVEADSLVVNGGSEFRSTENRLGQGAKLTLEAGVTDPTAPPGVQPFWKALEFDASGLGTLYGLAWAGGKYWTMAGRTSTIGDESVISIDGATGAVGDEIPMTGGFSPVGGVTAIGSELFMLGPKANAAYKYFVRVYSTSGTFLREWEYAEAGWGPGNPLGYKPGIGNNGTDVVIAHCTDAGSLNVRTYNKTTGALLITLNMNDNTASDIAGVHVGAADWGGGTFVTINKASTGKFYSFTTAGVVDLTKTFDAANGVQDTGVVFHDGKFYSLSSNGRISQYEASNMGDNSNNWWATYRWSVDADDDGINDPVSRIGPVKQFSWPRRSRLRFLGAPLPDGTGYITPSIAYKTTKPVRTDFRTPPFSVYGGEPTAWYSELPSNWQSGAYPGDVNDFPNATPSTLVSASNTFQVNGDGSGRWGPLTFNADGSMTSTAIPAWVPITSFPSGFAPNATWGFAPAYRIWPDGKVEWRGVVAGNMPASAITSVLNVPTAARPAQPVNLTAAVAGAAGSLAVSRIEFGGLSTPTKLTVMGNGAARSWVSLENICYYKS